jgi:flagellar biosynthesis protein FlhA
MLTDSVKRNHPVVVEELTPSQLSLGEVQRVLQALLEENVSIRDLVRIYEALSLRARVTKDLDQLVESAREALGPAVVAPYASGRTVHVVSFEPGLEQRMLEYLRPTETGAVLALDVDLGQSLLSELITLTQQAEEQNVTPVLACAPQLRSAVRRLTTSAVPRLPVVSYSELTGPLEIRSVGVVSGQTPALAM